MGDITVVERTVIVVVGIGFITLFSQCIAQTERQIVVSRFIKAGLDFIVGEVRQKTHTESIFPVCCSVAERVVEIVKHKTAIGQFIQSWCHFRVNYQRVKCFGTKCNDVVALCNTGIFVFSCSRYRCQIVCDNFIVFSSSIGSCEGNIGYITFQSFVV